MRIRRMTSGVPEGPLDCASLAPAPGLGQGSGLGSVRCSDTLSLTDSPMGGGGHWSQGCGRHQIR